MARDDPRTAGSAPPLLSDMSGDTEPRSERTSADRLAFVDRLLATTPLIVALVDREGVLRFVSDAVRRVLHREPEELLGRHVAELVHSDDAALVARSVEIAAARSGESLRTRFRIQDGHGQERVLEATAASHLDDPEIAALVVNVADVTGQVTAERELAGSRERYRTLVEQLPAVTYVWEVDPVPGPDPEYYTSPQIEALLGFTPDEWHVDPNGWRDQIHPEDRDRVLEASARSEATGEPFCEEYRYRRRDGSDVWVRDEAVLLSRDPSGRPWLFQGVMTDMTARIVAERAAREHLQRFVQLAETAPVLIALTGVDGALTFGNPELEVVTGRSEHELAGMDLEQLTHPDDRARVRAAWTDAVRLGGRAEQEFRLQRPDGTVRWIQAWGVPVPGDDGVPGAILTVGTDVTDHRAAREQLDRDAEQTREAELELRRSLELLQEADRERRALVARLIEAHEDALARIADHVQDTPLQHLAAVSIRLQSLRNDLDDPGQLGTLDRLNVSVEQALARLRGLLSELRPRELDTDGLVPALRHYLREVAGTVDRAVLEGDLDREPSPGQRGAAYRIVQELVTDAVSRGARSLELEVVSRTDGFFLRLGTEGTHDVSTAAPAVAIDRVRLAGGTHSQRDDGPTTSHEVWLPWEPAFER